MTQQYYSILTNIGLAKEAAANIPGGSPVSLTHIAVGDGDGSVYNPVSTQTELVNEVYRTTLTHVAIDSNNSNQLIVEGVLNEEIGSFHVREVGIFDSEGDLFAIGKYPETYKPALTSGSGKRLYIRMILGFANAPQVNLIISSDINNDPNFSNNVNNALSTIDANLSNVINILADKLSKAANFSDLSNFEVARNNLGLKNGAITDFIGAIMAFATTSPPAGWLQCNGGVVSVSAYSSLSNAIYCGDANNSVAEWGYKCTNPTNPSGSRSTSGQYIVLIDLRGEFIRGWDNGRGVDGGRGFGLFQADAFQGHWHSFNTTFMPQSGSSTQCASNNSGTQTDRVKSPISDGVNGNPRTASETRPRNISLMYCIKY